MDNTMDHFDRFSGLIQVDEYSVQNALSLAIACALAHGPGNGEDEGKYNEIRKARVESWGFKFHGFISTLKSHDVDTQCYVMSDDANVVVIFRGSDTANDWLANFQAVYDPGPLEGTWVHEGFQDALYPGVMAITKLLDQAMTGDKKLWVTGHSLGGALCSLYAGMLIANSYSVYGVYTFGSPRPGNKDFRKALNEKIEGPHYRVVNAGDIVPHVPPEPFYHHPGERIILKDGEKVRSDQSWFEERVEALKVFLPPPPHPPDVNDNHSLMAEGEGYIPQLIKDLDQA